MIFSPLMFLLVYYHHKGIVEFCGYFNQFLVSYDYQTTYEGAWVPNPSRKRVNKICNSQIQVANHNHTQIQIKFTHKHAPKLTHYLHLSLTLSKSLFLSLLISLFLFISLCISPSLSLSILLTLYLSIYRSW